MPRLMAIDDEPQVLRQCVADALVRRARLLDTERVQQHGAAADQRSIQRRLGPDELRKLANA
jgi:hypothetical protein